MVSFLRKLLRLCRPYRQRLVLGVLMGLLGGLLEPLLMLCIKVAVDVTFPGANTLSATTPTFSADSIEDLPATGFPIEAADEPHIRIPGRAIITGDAAKTFDVHRPKFTAGFFG